MKFKDYALLISINAVIAGLIISFVVSNQGKSNQLSVTSEATKKPEAPQTDSMDDHHKPKPSNSSVFDGLTGKQAPDFTLESYDGKKYTLKSLKGKNVILFFNEGLMCYPACWNQIAAFGSDTQFNQKNTVVLNINVDNKNDWKDALSKMPELAKATVLFDSDRAVSTAYGVMTLPSSMHRGQFPGHTYVIVDKDGIVRFARDDSQMAVRNKELLAEVDRLL
ncbi:redoxin domain-containing protein [Candidatus Gottesmanbacteria bacterium]|nr:redoxin domain-containing protein [Candidatus Gottesmanbacteria bacterium]MBI5452950.1 redoxin domain-containing protein [Candidatus Gottesmanbacteria bacterium]